MDPEIILLAHRIRRYILEHGTYAYATNPLLRMLVSHITEAYDKPANTNCASMTMEDVTEDLEKLAVRSFEALERQNLTSSFKSSIRQTIEESPEKPMISTNCTPTIKDPKKFDGTKPEEFAQWYTIVWHKIISEEMIFTSDDHKIAYILGLTGLTPSRIVMSRMSPLAEPSWNDVMDVLTTLNDVYGDKNIVKTKRYEMDQLRQDGKPFRQFNAEFNALLPYQGWGRNNTFIQFIKRLDSNSKKLSQPRDHLTTSPSPSYTKAARTSSGSENTPEQRATLL